MPEKNEFRTAEVFAQNVLVGEISEKGKVDKHERKLKPIFIQFIFRKYR